MKLFNKKTLIFWILIFVLIPLLLSGKVNYPRQERFANDFTGVISSSVIQKINNIAIELKQKTGFGLAVAVVPDMQGEDSYRYATELYKKWEIGSKKDEGVLLLVAVKERKMKIEVGYGAEGFLPDGLCGEIADKYILPYLKNNNWNKGVLQGALALGAVAAEHYGVQLTGVPKYSPQKTSLLGKIIKLLIGLFIISLFFGGRLGFLPFLLLGGMGGSGGGWSGGSGGFGGFGGFGGGLSGGGGVGRSF